MSGILRYLFLFLLSTAAWSQTSIFNCSAFNANTSGACSVYQASGLTGQQFVVRGFATPIGSTAPQVQLVPPNWGHNAVGMAYYVAVPITPGFSTTFNFIPNGQNLALVVQNTSNQPGFEGNLFTSGAGCEGAFYQGAVNPPTTYSPNNVFALQVANAQNGLSYANTNFTYSSVQMFQSGITPCLPADTLAYGYVATNRISTSPVPQQATATQFSTTGDVYLVTLTYTGTHITMQMFDVTLGNACPGASCFAYTWPVSIPPIVNNASTAFVSLTEGSNVNLPGSTFINSWNYSQLSAAATPTFSPAAGTYGSTQSVTISDSTGSSYICYNFTGAPSTNGIGGCANGTLYSGAISTASGRTIFAVAGVSGRSADSAMGSASYAITGTASVPIFNQPGELYYNGNQTVALTASHGGVICYNTTGSPATNGSIGCTTGTHYTTPISVSSNETIYAVAGGTGFTDSAVTSVPYVINPYWDGNSPLGQAPANSPTFSPIPGTYSGAQTVTISSAFIGPDTPTICYFLGSSPPTLTPQMDGTGYDTGSCAQGTPYTGPITVSSTQTIYAMAGTVLTSLPSSLVQGTFTINASSSTGSQVGAGVGLSPGAKLQ